MNGRKLYREYLKYKGHDCTEFIKLEEDPYYSVQEITYKDSQGILKTTTIDPVKMIHWIIKSFSNGVWEHYNQQG